MAEVKVIEVQIKSNLDEANNDVLKLKTNLKNASSEAKDFDKAIGGKKGASFTELKDSIGGLVPGFEKVSSGASLFNKQLLLLVANPIGAVIAAVVLAVLGLVAIFKTFQPLVDKVEQGLAALSAVGTTIKNTFIAITTGTKSLGQAFSGLGGEITSAAKRTMELVKAQQDLEDVLAQQEVQTSRTRAEINKLNVQAKNRALSEEERLKLLQKASLLENQNFLQRRKNADEEVRQAREAIAIKAGFSKAEIKLLKEQGLAAKELAESKGGNFDEEFKILAAAQKNRIGLEDESTANLEKNQNKQDALFDAQQAKRETQAAATKARQEKLDANKKEEADKLKVFEDDVLKNQQQMNVDKVNAEIQDSLDEKERKRQSLEDISAMVDAIDADNLNKNKIKSDEEIRIEKETLRAKEVIAQANFDLVNKGINLLAGLAGKNKALQKAAIIAQAGIGIFSVIKDTQAANAAAIAPPPIGLGPILGTALQTRNTIGGAISIASITAASAKALAAVGSGGSVGGGSVGSSGGGGATAPAAPSFNVVGASATNQLAQTIGNKEAQPIKAYVVSNDVTTAQSLDRNIIQSASIG